MDKPVKANLFMLCFMVYNGLLPIAVAVLIKLIPGVDYDMFEKYITLFQHLLVFALPIGFYCMVTGNRLRDIVPHDTLALKNVILVVFIALFTLPLMLWVGSITEFFVPDNEDIVSQYIERYSMGFLVAAIGVMPGVFEELMFRGVIMTGYKRMGLIKAAFFSALFFGIMHLDLYQLAYAAVAGMIFGILVHYTNSIYSSMLAHFIINSIQVVLSKIQDPDTAAKAEEYTHMEIFADATIFLAFTLPVLIGLLYLFIRVNRGRNIDYKYSLDARREFVTDLEAGRGRIIDVPFVSVIVFYILYMKIMNFMTA